MDVESLGKVQKEVHFLGKKVTREKITRENVTREKVTRCELNHKEG